MLDEIKIQKEVGKKANKAETVPAPEYHKECSLDIQVTVAAEITGIDIDEEMWTEAGAESTLEEQEPSHITSNFQLRIPFLNEEVIQSESKLWNKDFVMGEEGTGKCDFNLKIR